MLERETESHTYDFELTIPDYALREHVEEYLASQEKLNHADTAIKEEKNHIASWRKIDTLCTSSIGSVISLSIFAFNFHDWINFTWIQKFGFIVAILAGSGIMGFLMTAALSDVLPNKLKIFRKNKIEQEKNLTDITTSIKNQLEKTEVIFNLLLTLDKIQQQINTLDNNFHEHYTIIKELKEQVKLAATLPNEECYKILFPILIIIQTLPQDFNNIFNEFYAKEIQQNKQEKIELEYQQYLKKQGMKELISTERASLRNAI